MAKVAMTCNTSTYAKNGKGLPIVEDGSAGVYCCRDDRQNRRGLTARTVTLGLDPGAHLSGCKSMSSML